ncbi:MAG: hypothetical protein RSD47_09630 [Romboutsia sp.]
MNVNTAQGDSIETLLRQIGASKITKVRGLLYFIKFNLKDEIEVSYVYNINSKNQYFLQRIKPYPIPQGVFTDEYEIVSFIKKDLDKFNIAINSKNFNLFLDTSEKINLAATNMEILFLNYNVNSQDFKKLDEELNNILNEIELAKNNSKSL